MAAPPFAPAPAAEPLLDPTAWTEKDRRYWITVGVLVLVAFVMRVYQLDVPSFQHDEAIYSIFSLNFDTYNFDPIYHGPALYYVIHFFFARFGDGELVARMVSVVMALVTFWLIVGPARRWLGPRAALFVTALYAISPVMMAYQRRILFDAFVVVLTLGSVLLFQKIRSEALGTWAWCGAWVGLVAVLVTFLATKANAFFVVAMLGSFWVLDRLRGLGPRDWVVRLPTQLPLLMFGAVSAAAIYWGPRYPDNAPLTARHERFLIAVCVVSSAFLWEWLRRTGTGARLARKANADGEEPGLPYGRIALCGVLCVLVGAFVFAFFFGHGAFWYRTSWETFRTQYWNDILQAMPRMFEYWNGQQKAPRLPGRHDFYLTLMIFYELPILVAFVGGVVHASRNRTPFTDLLLWWSFTSWTLYAMANEKVPWLMIHLVAPFAILGGWWLAQVRVRASQRRLFQGACLLGAGFLLRNTVATSYQSAVDNREPMFYAFTPDSFKELMLTALDEVKNKPGTIWIYNAWPPSWYMRPTGKGKEFPGVPVLYTEHEAPAEPLRFVVCTEADWDGKFKERFAGWHKWTFVPGPGGGPMMDAGAANPHILNWPRGSWFSLRPDLFLQWFFFRKAEIPDNPPAQSFISNKAFLTEWSHIPVVVATPP